MYDVAIYRAEREAGLEHAIRSTAKVCYASVARRAEPWDVGGRALEKLRHIDLGLAKGSQGDFDLHYLDTVLVTTGWNLNDDVFDPVETWLARHTPEDKQLNYEHDCAQIIGHITSNWAMGEDGKALADDLVLDDVPGRFHIVTGAVLYKFYDKDELQKRTDKLLAEIAKGEWFVSMECLFKGFDYALKAKDGSCKVLARNDQTAFLSKHLRVYGGSGQYGEYRVGRLMRNIVFSGKGMVRKPANPESVIFPESEAFSGSKASREDFSRILAGQVYSLVEATPDNRAESKAIMTVDIETLNKQLTEARAEIERLKASQQEAVVSDLKAKLEAAEAAKTQAAELLKKASDELTSAKSATEAEAKKVSELTEKLAKAAEDLDAAKAELKGLYAEQTKASRKAVAMTRLKMDDATAAEFVAANEALSDESFSKQVDVVAKAMTAWTTNNPQAGNTTFSGPTPAAAPKGTPAPTAPKATDKPTGGKAAEQDEGGEKTAGGSDLDAVEGTEAAVSTVAASGGVSDIQKAIAEWFGVDSDEETETK